MSDIANVSALGRTPVQLPVSWYVDPAIHELEQRVLFPAGPGYAGHDLMVPEVGDYYVLPGQDDSRVLVHGTGGIELVGNVCRHRQAILLEGHGKLGNIVCPVHRWTYDLQGKLLGAPEFPGNPCLDLPIFPTRTWNGLRFTGNRDVARDLALLSLVDDFDFSGHVLDRVDVDSYACNWKSFMDPYLELYHVTPAHPGLSRFTDSGNYCWEFGPRYSLQTLGVYNNLERAGSPVYRRWQEAVLRRTGGQPPKYGALWFIYYPNVMLEWYPETLVVSTLYPTGPESCVNVMEFYYPEEIARFERDFVEAQKQAYAETAVEDKAIGERLQRGRRALFHRGIDQAGPCHSPLEDGLRHFYEFMRRQLDPHLP